MTGFTAYRFVVAEQREQHAQTARFAADRMQTRLHILEDVATDIAGRFAEMATVDAEDFGRVVARHIEGLPISSAVRGVALAPEIDRAGPQPLTIWPESDGGTGFPAVFAWPPAAAPNIRGYDMWTDPSRREAIQAAFASGEPRASAFVVLTQDAEGGARRGAYSTLMVTPLRAVPNLRLADGVIAAERGMVPMGIAVEQVFNQIFSVDRDLNGPHLVVRGPVRDASGETVMVPIFTNHPERNVGADALAFPVRFAGIDLELLVAPGDAVAGDVANVVTVGLVLTGTVLSFGVAGAVRRLRRAALVEQSTATRLRDLNARALDASGLGLLSLERRDEAGNQPQVVLDPRAATLLGLPDDVGETDFATLLAAADAADRDAVGDALLRAPDDGPRRLEIRVQGSGEPRWIELDVSALRRGAAATTQAVAFVRDVTARKQASEQLRASEERFRLMAQATRDVVWDWNATDDRLWHSDAYAAFAGADTAHWPDSLADSFALVHEDDRRRVQDGFLEALHGDTELWSAEYRVTKAEGSPASVIDRALIVRDEAGRPIRMVGATSDVTELRQLDARLSRAEKLETVGQLTGSIAHDFNNLLTIVLGNAELIADTAADPTAREAAASIVQAGERGAELTSSLLAFSRRLPLAPRPTDVHALVESNRRLFRQAVHEGIALELVLAATRPMAMVDPSKLQAALMNLIVNSGHAIEGNGRILIETADAVLDATYAARHPEVEPGAYVMVAVSDDGAGMTPEVAARAFEPFFTTKKLGVGSGLGLSSVYGFAKQSRGHVKIYSEPGDGTSVKLYLPSTDDAGQSWPATPTTGEIPRGAGEHVLVVEDDAALREHATAQIGRLGYRVSAAGDGDQALAILENHDDVALLFTDVVMPGHLNGRRLAEAAVARRPSLKVLFTSGYTRNVIVHHGRLDEGVDLLPKPYRQDELARRLAQSLHG